MTDYNLHVYSRVGNNQYLINMNSFNPRMFHVKIARIHSVVMENVKLIWYRFGGTRCTFRQYICDVLGENVEILK
jgi:hypothetical protein